MSIKKPSILYLIVAACFTISTDLWSKGCYDDVDCGDSSQNDIFCYKEPGRCDDEKLGICDGRPEVCPLHIDPVCGCDGVTYVNECKAAAAGVNVAQKGACGDCQSNEDCDGRQFCFQDSCGGAEESGFCQVRPRRCPKILKQVCGCDGATYDNECYAWKSGVNIAHSGKCKPQPDCEHNAWCDDNEYCNKDACYGVGHCTTIPIYCPAIYAPVCGCDGQTYSNECMAAMAGANVADEGPCLPEVCGTIAGIQCPIGAFCEFEEGTCQIIDNAGTCTPLDSVCPEFMDPVCGCDGQTYNNDCLRRQAGVSKASHGPCECKWEIDCLPGFVPVDTDGDFCNDSCKMPCENVCDCSGLNFSSSCSEVCLGENCVNYWTCENNFCEDQCGVISPNSPTCNDCESNEHCTENEYCAKAVGECGKNGQCQAKPKYCTRIYAPVCGCDNVTYSNSCVAASEGVSIKHRGACETPTCQHRPQSDLDGDCKVTLIDLSIMAAEWLKCGITPATFCEGTLTNLPNNKTESGI